jgi:hypothetical protein
MQKMHKPKKTVFAASLTLIILITLSTLLLVQSGNKNSSNPAVFVGVSYGGSSVSEGKQLIDKVKSYTNLFVLQSGSLQRDFNSVNELGDYAVSSGMYFLPYFGNYIESSFSVWLESTKQRWGNHLIGVYYSDELGGKMLDDYTEFTDASGDVITKTRYSDIVVKKASGETVHYEINGNINVLQPGVDGQADVYLTYFPDGTIKTQDQNQSPSSSLTYQQLMNNRPFQNFDEAAQKFTSKNQKENNFLKNQTTVFTSDYALYWYDYQAGYDVLLAQLGWNISVNQQIGLCRGAANMQGKDWGAVITWKYNQPPYLDSGPEIYNQLKASYEGGAKYFVLFNYYEEGKTNPYGTLNEEHFKGLEDFWNYAAKNPLAHGSVKADSVLVLPKNFGCAMRWREDIVWGIFKANQTSRELYDLTQSALTSHGSLLDIVYDDTTYQLPEQYKAVIKPPN